MNGKVMTFSNLISVYKRIRKIIFPYLLVNLFKQGYFSFIKIYKKFVKLSMKTMVLTSLNLLKLKLKLLNIRKRKIHIPHYRTPNDIYACILPHAW